MKKHEQEIKTLVNAVVMDGGRFLFTAVSGDENVKRFAFTGDTSDGINLIEIAIQGVLQDMEAHERAYIADQLLRVAIEQNRAAMKKLDESRGGEQ